MNEYQSLNCIFIHVWQSVHKISCKVIFHNSSWTCSSNGHQQSKRSTQLRLPLINSTQTGMNIRCLTWCGQGPASASCHALLQIRSWIQMWCWNIWHTCCMWHSWPTPTLGEVYFCMTADAVLLHTSTKLSWDFEPDGISHWWGSHSQRRSRWILGMVGTISRVPGSAAIWQSMNHPILGPRH